MEQTKPSIFRTIFGMMINLAVALRGAFSSKWYLSMTVSALAFGLQSWVTTLFVWRMRTKAK
ncbi:MAG: hypothetical protein PHT78_08710 [Desulfitobacteriaceae bacterium]|nr:hypothetical protein [Desulfitobacteriaceae bacterium]